MSGVVLIYQEFASKTGNNLEICERGVMPGRVLISNERGKIFTTRGSIDWGFCASTPYVVRVQRTHKQAQKIIVGTRVGSHSACISVRP